MTWKTILCPTDYTGLSELAVRHAAALAHDYQARLIFLHAVETLGPEKVSFGEVESLPQPEAYRRRLWDELHRHVQLSDPLVRQEFVLSEEDPASAIVDAAKQYDCDLIVMGTHVRNGLRRWLQGSVAEEVLRRSPCPVLFVKEAVQTPGHVEVGTALHPVLIAEHG